MPKPNRFESVLAPQLPGLFRTAYRLAGNTHDAEDLVQEACVRACENLAAFEACENPDRWLLRVMYNRFVDGARRRKRSPVVVLNDAPAPQIAASGPEDLAEQAERERALQDAYSKLESAQRALLSLRAEGYGLAEIEEITGIGRDVLRARLHRARRSLARYLDHQSDQTGTDQTGLPRLGSAQ